MSSMRFCVRVRKRSTVSSGEMHTKMGSVLTSIPMLFCRSAPSLPLVRVDMLTFRVFAKRLATKAVAARNTLAGVTPNSGSLARRKPDPFFSTDTTAALRAAEMEADIILLAKKVDAVYSDDPEKNPHAVKYTNLTHREVLEKNLKVMDSTAASLCRDNNIPLHVFALDEPGNVIRAIYGEKIGTIIV